VEDVIYSHPDVAEYAVIGVPDEAALRAAFGAP
jgi:acyl-coenzyme A synthetase/AMP-(fatty) acid ligase